MHRLLSARDEQWRDTIAPSNVPAATLEFQSPESEFASRTLLPGRLVCHIANGCALRIRWVDETEAVRFLLGILGRPASPQLIR